MHPPFGPPTLASVVVDGSGRVACVTCDARLASSEAAIFLQSLLGSDGQVPGALRYTLARALLEVDAPPFDDVDEFSRALARHERRGRREVVRELCVRGRMDLVKQRASVVQLPARPGVRTMTPVSLSRATVNMHVPDSSAHSFGAPPQPSSRSSAVALAAGFAIGIMLIGTGQILHDGDVKEPLPVAQSTAQWSRPVQPVAMTMPAATGSNRAVVETSAVKPHVARSTAPKTRLVRNDTQSPVAPAAPRPHQRRGFFGWLHSKIAIRVDPL
ncbi:MAG TPA: hypothetical protein VH583_22860 [Vicinamibacterales bacterium]